VDVVASHLPYPLTEIFQGSSNFVLDELNASTFEKKSIVHYLSIKGGNAYGEYPPSIAPLGPLARFGLGLAKVSSHDGVSPGESEEFLKKKSESFVEIQVVPTVGHFELRWHPDSQQAVLRGLRAWKKALVVGSLFLGLVGQAVASSYVVPSVDRFATEAQLIVQGTIRTSVSDWGSDADGIRRLFTTYELEVAEVLKGSESGKLIYFRELGGEKDGTTYRIEGSAQFSENEAVVVFLKGKNNQGSYDLNGMSLGKADLQGAASEDAILVGTLFAGQSKPWRLKDLKAMLPPPPATPIPVSDNAVSATTDRAISGSVTKDLEPLKDLVEPESNSFRWVGLLMALLFGFGIVYMKKRIRFQK
jgi:hypothetical protein